MAANMMKYCGSIALILLCLAPLAVWGQVLSDPTRPPVGLDDASPGSFATTYAPVRGLQTVIISPTHCAAIIDGKTVELGAKHGAERLVEVSERGVILLGEHGRRALTLFPAVSMKITEILPINRQVTVCKYEQKKQTGYPDKRAGQKEKK